MSISSSAIKPVILVSVILVYWLIGYYPIHPLPAFHNAGVLQTDDGLEFSSPGIAYSKNAPDWIGDAIHSSSLDVLLDVQASAADQTGPARILTISENTGFRNITVGQQGVDLVVRLRRSEESFNGTPEFIVSNVFTDLGRHVLDISVKPGKLAISVDGTNRLTEKLPDDAFDTWVRDYRLAMGNEITFDRPWLGTIHQAMIDVKDKRVDYLVPGTLAIPETYYLQPHPDRMSLVPFYQEYYSVSIIQDWIVNFIGFVPLGLLVVLLYPNWSNVRRAAIICLGVSLVIETMQLYLPWRHPAIEDLILNMLGGACGAWLGVEYCKTRKCF